MMLAFKEHSRTEKIRERREMVIRKKGYLEPYIDSNPEHSEIPGSLELLTTADISSFLRT